MSESELKLVEFYYEIRNGHLNLYDRSDVRGTGRDVLRFISQVKDEGDLERTLKHAVDTVYTGHLCKTVIEVKDLFSDKQFQFTKYDQDYI